MAALVASPLVLLPRDKKEDGLPNSSMFSTTPTTEQGLSRFTNNPITFVKASDPPPSSVPLSSKYEVLDDSKLPDVSKSSARDHPFIGPLLPPDENLQPSPNAGATVPDAVVLSPSPSSSTSTQTLPPKQLWTTEIPHTFPSLGSRPVNVARGLDNVGNTCFLNSVLQCLLHTPQLLHVALQHSRDKCKDCPKTEFCMIKAFGETAWQALYSTDSRPRPYIRPSVILGNLGKIAKGLRRGRQEDAHEFLRYSIDAFQRAALAGTDPKLPHGVKETTWVHKLFGGRLRSRVTCQSCGYPSDTFDSLLDLSIDIHRKESVRDALDAFVAIEKLAGADKYKCEKCNKPVVAEKQFTIHDAPQILTVHLKRFTPMGRKLTQPVKYSEQLSLARYMSKGQYGPTYSLYGVISHAGSGPNSGHYYAHVQSAKGVWHEMNDESVTPIRSAPLGLKNAYILFYMRVPGSFLQSAIHAPTSTTQASLLAPPAEIVPAKERTQKKRSIPQDDDGEDLGVQVSPLAPSNRQLEQPIKRPKLDSGVVVSDPAAIALKAKIMAATVIAQQPGVKSLLAEYEGQSSDTEVDLNPCTSNTQTSLTAVEPSSFATDIPCMPPTRSHLSIPSLFPTPPPNDMHASTSAMDSATEPERASAVVISHAPERAHGKPGESSRKSRHSSDENDRSFGGSEAGEQPHHHHHKRRHGHHREKLRWKASGSNPFSASTLRDTLYDDRAGPNHAANWSGVELSKKHRMNKKRRSLI